ncbi:MAG: DUF2769 domain-containing protein [Methanobacterium sp.]
MAKVEFNAKNIERCLCPECPVQVSSPCVRQQLNKIQESGGVPTDPKESPGVYCGTGMTTCSDIDRNQPCQCSKCEVWKEYELGKGQPAGYFCVNGEAR